MIQEIISFENEIRAETKLSPPNGLNILVGFDENNQSKIQFGIWQKNSAVEADFLISNDTFFNECRDRYQYSIGIHHNCRFVRQIETFSSFVIGYTKGNGLKVQENNWIQNIHQYFDKAKVFSDDFTKDDKEIERYSVAFAEFVSKKMLTEISKIHESIAEYNKIKENKKKITLTDNDRIFCYLQNIELEVVQKTFSKCVAELGGGGYCDDLTTYAPKKPFLYHYTSPFGINYCTTDTQNVIIKNFINKLKKGTFPRPLPIFIDKDELNNEILRLYEASGRKITYSKILENLFDVNPLREDIQKYYLLFAQVEGKSGLKIKDLDFVSSFRYDFKCKIKDIFDTQYNTEVSNIFEFERKIVKDLFDNCLVGENENEDKGKKTYYNNYFNEDFSAKTDNTYHLVTKYRKAFFDFIYKSQTQAITGVMFRDIILSGVLDTIKDSEYRTKDSQKEERVKKLLNIYFNLNSIFDTNNSNFNHINMASFTRIHLEKIRQLVSEEEKHIENDEEAAFYTGQLIHYLLGQSGVSSKSHSLLLPYLQKNDFELLKEKIMEDIKRYSHAISFNNLKFNKLSSEILGYKLEGSMNKYMSFILAGYFSKNVLYSKS